MVIFMCRPTDGITVEKIKLAASKHSLKVNTT